MKSGAICNKMSDLLAMEARTGFFSFPFVSSLWFPSPKVALPSLLIEHLAHLPDEHGKILIAIVRTRRRYGLEVSFSLNQIEKKLQRTRIPVTREGGC